MKMDFLLCPSPFVQWPVLQGLRKETEARSSFMLRINHNQSEGFLKLFPSQTLLSNGEEL